MSLSTIPDEILCHIFDRIPLEELFTLSRVSHRWNSVQTLACNRCRKLTLCISPPEHYAGDLLINSKFVDPFVNSRGCYHSWIEFHQLTDEKARTLVSKYPKISNLVVLYECATVETLEHLSLMLKCWKSSLITFKLIFNYKYMSTIAFSKYKYFNSPSLFDAINQLTKLRHLTFDTMHQIFPARAAKIFPLKLTQLESISFKSYDYGPTVCQWVFSFIRSSPNLAKIQIGNSLTQFGQNDHLYLLEPRFASKIDYAYMDTITVQNLDRYCSHFAGITYFSLETDFDSFVDNQLRALSQLEHLDSLRLYLTQTGALPTRQQICTKLVLVRKLCLNVDAEHHQILDLLPLDLIFPRIELLYIGKRFNMCCDMRETTCAEMFLKPIKEQFGGKNKIRRFLFRIGGETVELNIDDF